jgi:hypothetical protein
MQIKTLNCWFWPPGSDRRLRLTTTFWAIAHDPRLSTDCYYCWPLRAQWFFIPRPREFTNHILLSDSSGSLQITTLTWCLTVNLAGALIMQCSPCTCSWNTEMCREYLHASSRAMLYHFKNVSLFSCKLLMCSIKWNMSTGKHTTFTQFI